MGKLYETFNEFNEKKSDTKVRVFCRICFAACSWSISIIYNSSHSKATKLRALFSP